MPSFLFPVSLDRRRKSLPADSSTLDCPFPTGIPDVFVMGNDISHKIVPLKNGDMLPVFHFVNPMQERSAIRSDWRIFEDMNVIYAHLSGLPRRLVGT